MTQTTLLVANIEEPKTASSLSRKILDGVSALGAATAIERGLSFLANLAAARMAGAATFGAYSLALTTANNIASYAGAGIGSTATRFSGEHADDSDGQRSLRRALLLVSLSSAALAAAVLFGGAGPLAQLLLRNPGLTDLLRWAALASAAIILLECFRGYLVGRRRLMAQISLSAAIGIGYLVGIPWASRSGPSRMVWMFAAVTAAAVLTIAFFENRDARTELERSGTAKPQSVTCLAREVWSFGLVQLAGVIGLNAAGFWMASLIVRSDSSLVQMGLFAAANQVRNMAGLAPALFTQTSFGLLADRRHEPSQVMGASSCAASFLSIVLAGGGMAILPWMLPAAYGASFSRAIFPACIALAISIVHLSNGPAAARLTILSLRSTAVINTAWAIVVVSVGMLLLSRFTEQAASTAMASYLIAHIISAAAVTWKLRRGGCLPKGAGTLFLVPSGGALLLLALAYARTTAFSRLAQLGFTLLIVLVTAILAGFIFQQGRRQGWAPRISGSSFRVWERIR